MLLTSFTLPEDVHLLDARTVPRTAGGVRVDARPPVRPRWERRTRR
jgi:hypothetical protein